MSINSVGNIGYYPNATTFTSKRYNGTEDFKPGFYNPEQKEKAEKRGKTLITVAALAVVGTAAWFLTKGKGQKYVTQLKDYFTKGKGSEYIQKAKDFFKNLFQKGGKTAEAGAKTAAPVAETAAEAGVKIAEKNTKVAETIANIETKNTNSGARKLVEDAIKDTPTKAQQAAYDRAIAYVPPTAEQKVAIEANNAAVKKATAEARQIQNNISDESLDALKNLRNKLPENPVPTIVKEPSAKVKKQQIEQAWAEYTRKPEVTVPKQNIPTSAEIWAKTEAEAAKVAKEEAEVMAQMFPKAPKKIDLPASSEPAKALDPKLWETAGTQQAAVSADELEMLKSLGF